jgi:ABC-type anion transport system duplicated permease subunit
MSLGSYDAVQPLLQNLLSQRRFLRSIAAADELSSDRLHLETMDRAIVDLDALGSFMATHLLVKLFKLSEAQRALQDERQEREQAEEQRRTRREQVRDQKLARFVAALAFPAMWISYWSAKVAPEVDVARGVLYVFGGALTIGLGSYVVTSAIFRPGGPSRPRRSGRSGR